MTNETRAKLIGVSKTDIAFGRIPSYDTDANAVAELRAFVRARGKVELFQLELWNVVLGCIPLFEPSYEQGFDLLDATPQQQTAAFDAVFRDDLERINDRIPANLRNEVPDMWTCGSRWNTNRD